MLHGRSYRETSMILELFTASFGRIGLLARGVKGKKKSSVSELQPFTPLLISWRGRGELPTLTSVEKQPQIMPDLQGSSLLSALYVNELILRLTHRDDPLPELFSLYQNVIAQLAEPAKLEQNLRFFELDLLQAIGYGSVLDQDIESGQAICAESHYRFELEHGATLGLPAHRGQVALSGSTLLALHQRVDLDETEKRESKQLMRRLLALYLGGKPLKTRELFKTY